MTTKERLLDYLRAHPEWHYGLDLVKALGISRATIYIYLGGLEETGLVERREGVKTSPGLARPPLPSGALCAMKHDLKPAELPIEGSGCQKYFCTRCHRTFTLFAQEVPPPTWPFEECPAREKEFLQLLEHEGYFFPGKLPATGEWIGLRAFMYTVGLCIGLDEWGYRRRFCYPDLASALEALIAWDGEGDPPGPWIKEKGEDGERTNPTRAATFKEIPIVTEGP
jgi:hypothetical protein